MWPEAFRPKSLPPSLRRKPSLRRLAQTQRPKKEEEKDPFAVPEDADADTLLAFVQEVKSKRGRTVKTLVPVLKAVVSATEALRELEEKTDEQEMRAVREAMSALSFLRNFERSYQKNYDALIDSLRDDDRLPFKKIAIVADFTQKARQCVPTIQRKVRRSSTSTKTW